MPGTYINKHVLPQAPSPTMTSFRRISAISTVEDKETLKDCLLQKRRPSLVGERRSKGVGFRRCGAEVGC